MIIEPKWDKRNNQRTIDMSIYIVLATINRIINNEAEKKPSGTNTKPREP